MNVEVEQSQSSTSMTFREAVGRVLHLVKRTLLYWPVFVAFGTAAIVAFFLTPLLIPPVYESGATLLYREIIRSDTALGINSITETKRARNSRLRESALSRATLLPIITSNGLYRDILERRDEIEAVEAMRRATRFVVADSDAVTIYFRGDSPQQVVKVVRDLVASTSEHALKYGVEQVESTVTFLQAQLTTAAKELSKAEQALAEFLSAHPEFALESATQTPQMGTAIRAEAREQASTRSSDPLAALNRHAARLQRRIQDASKPQVQSSAPANLAPTTVAETPPTVAEAERNLKRAQDVLAERQSHYTEKHPDVVAARAQLRLAEQRLATARATVVAPPAPAPALAPPTSAGPPDPASLDKLKAELNQVQRMMATARNAEARKDNDATDTAVSESGGIVAIETEWSSLNREVVAARERNDQIQKQLFKASLLAKVQTSGGGIQMSVVDEPYEPRRPVTRGKKTTGAIGAAMVMFLGLLTALVLALTDDRLFMRQDVKLHGIGPIIHVVPAVAKHVREARDV